MTKLKRFLTFTDDLLNEAMTKLRFTSAEKFAVRNDIHSIFQQKSSPEEIFYKILDYFDENPELCHLIDRVEMFYLGRC